MAERAGAHRSRLPMLWIFSTRPTQPSESTASPQPTLHQAELYTSLGTPRPSIQRVVTQQTLSARTSSAEKQASAPIATQQLCTANLLTVEARGLRPS